MPIRITTDHVYDVGSGTVIEATDNLLVCINGVYYTLGDWMYTSDDGYDHHILRCEKVNADGKVDPQVLVDANVAVEE